jgi:cytochrome c biogenesis protein CcmG/thiol:disulfide interchange protein DsbE
MASYLRWWPAVLGIVVLVGCGQPPGPIPAVAHSSREPAPEIKGVDSEGKPLKLSDYRGKVVLVDFWFAT